jgi:hypothetical protein
VIRFKKGRIGRTIPSLSISWYSTNVRQLKECREALTSGNIEVPVIYTEGEDYLKTSPEEGENHVHCVDVMPIVSSASGNDNLNLKLLEFLGPSVEVTGYAEHSTKPHNSPPRVIWEYLSSS